MMQHAMTRSALILSLFAIATAGTLALTNRATLPRIACNAEDALRNSLAQVMPAERHDNALLADAITVTDKRLGRGEHQVWRARLDGKNSGAIIEAEAPDGYGGRIKLLVGVSANGTITGVRMVPPHNETPGLGDKIDIRKSGWMLGFEGRSLDNTADAQWAVRKDGGDFDSFTGATITPRAVVAQVYRALQFYREQQQALFDAAPAQSASTEDCHD